MAIRAMWNFNHLPVGTVVGSSGFLMNSFGITHASGGYSVPTPTVMADGSLEFLYGQSGSSSTIASYINVPASTVTDGVSKKSFIGLLITESSGYYTWYSKPAGMVINDLVLFYRNDPALPPIYTTFYLEVGIDRVNKEITLYVDNVLVKTITGAAAAAICDSYNGANTWRWGWISTSSYGDSWRGNISNIYFSDEVDGETVSARQGPVSVTPITITSATGVDWISSDGRSLLADITTEYTNAASLTAPMIASGEPATDLTLGFSIPGADNRVIAQMQFFFDAKRSNNLAAQPVIKMKMGENSKTLTPFAFTGTALAYGLKSGFSKVAPDDSAWTVGKLKASKLTINVAV